MVAERLYRLFVYISTAGSSYFPGPNRLMLRPFVHPPSPDSVVFSAKQVL